MARFAPSLLPRSLRLPTTTTTTRSLERVPVPPKVQVGLLQQLGVRSTALSQINASTTTDGNARGLLKGYGVSRGLGVVEVGFLAWLKASGTEVVVVWKRTMASTSTSVDNVEKRNEGPGLHPRFKNIVFDLGNVLLRWDPQGFAMDLFSESIPEEEIRRAVAEELVRVSGHAEMWKNLDRGLLSFDQAVELIDQPEVVSRHELRHLTRERFEQFLRVAGHRYFPVIPAGLELFQTLKARGYRCFVLSNFMREMFEPVSRRYDDQIFRHMDGLSVSGFLGCAKPEKEIYQSLLETHKLKPEECLFIDDVQVNVDAAKAAGIEAILCDTHDNVVRQLKELKVL